MRSLNEKYNGNTMFIIFMTRFLDTCCKPATREIEFVGGYFSFAKRVSQTIRVFVDGDVVGLSYKQQQSYLWKKIKAIMTILGDDKRACSKS